MVWVTAPSKRVAQTIAKAVLQKRLAACASLIPGLESHYWWQGRLESSRETLLVMKTQREKLPALEQAIIALHPYDTPEIVALAWSHGNVRYMDWVTHSLKPPSIPPSRD